MMISNKPDFRIDATPMSSYNSLLDPHLSGFFSNTRVRRHLRRVGLITRNGDVISESTYRLNLTRRRRNLMTQSLEEPRIKRKADEMQKLEFLCQGDGMKANDRFPRIARLAPSSEQDEHRRSATGERSPRCGDGRSTSAPAHVSARHSATTDQDNRDLTNGNGVEEEDEDGARQMRQTNGFSGKHQSDYQQQQHQQQRYQNTITQEAKSFWDSSLLMTHHSLDYKSAISPYLMPIPLPPEVPPPKSSPRTSGFLTARRLLYHGNDSHRHHNKLSAGKDQDYDNGDLHITPRSHTQHYAGGQTNIGSQTIVTMQYFGSHLDLNQRWLDPRDDVLIEQQHCGGNTVIVYRDHISPGTVFSFTSKRHPGFPFSVTVYVNGRQDTRLSTCCECKHSVGTRLGGRFGRFGLVSVENGVPCESCEQKPDKDKTKSDLCFETINKAKLLTRQSNDNKQKTSSYRAHDETLTSSRENTDFSGQKSADRHNKGARQKKSSKSADAWSPRSPRSPKTSAYGSPSKCNGKEAGRGYPKSILHKDSPPKVSNVLSSDSFFNELFVERSDERVTDTEAEYTELFEETEEEIVETITRTETSDSQVKPDTAVSEAEATAGNPEEREIVTVNNEADIDDKPAAGGAEEESAAVQNQKGTHQTDEATGIGSSEEEAGSKNDEQSAASAESDAGDEKVRQDQQDNNVEHPVMQNEIQETGISETVERTDTESEAGKDTAKETEAPQDVTEDSLVAAEDETNDTGESAPGAFTTNGEDSMRDELSPVNKESMEHTTESDGTFDDPLGNGIPDEEGEPAASDVIETDEKPRDTAIVDESEENEKETDSAVVEMDKTDMEELEKSASGENVAEELAASDLHKPIDATGKEGEELLESTSSTKDISETEEQPVEGVAVEEDKVSDADKPEENLNESMAAEPISADQDVREQTENQASSEVEIRDSIAANFIEAPSIAIDENEPVEELKLSEDNDAQAVLNESDEATVSDATKDQEVVLAAGADKVDPVYDDEEGERSMINMAAEERDTDDHLLPNVNKADDQNAAEPQEANEEIKNSEIDITSDACEHRDDTTAANANDNDAMIEESRAAEVIETEREAYELQPGDESIQEATAPEITGSVEQAEDNATDAGEATKEIDDTAASDEGQMLNEGEEAVTADVIAAKMSAESHDLDNEATDQLLEGRIDEVAEQKAAAEVETEDTKTDEALALAADEANEEEAVIDDNNEKQEELANVNGGDNNTAATDADESAEEPNGSEPEEGSADTKTASEQPETQAAPTEGDLTEVTDASVEANERPEEVTEPSEDEKDIIKDEDSEQKAEPTAVGDDVSTAATPGENEQTEPTAPADEAVVEAKDSETFDEDEKTEPAAPVNETLSETPCKNEQTEPTAPADEAVTEAKDSETFDEDENTEPAAPVNETLNEAPGENEQTEPTAPADEAVTEAKDSETFDKDDKTEPTAPVNEMLSETPGENEQIEPMAPADETVTEAKDSETFDEDENTEPAAPVNETLNEAPGENEQTEPTAPADEAVTEAKDSETFDEDDKTEPTAPVNEMLSETPGENEQTEPTAPADEAVTEAKDSETFDEDDKTEPTASVNEMLSETPGENEQTEPTAPADEAVTEAKDSETFDEDDKTEPTASVNEMLSETPGENEQTEPTAPADEAVTEAKDSETFDEDKKAESTASVKDELTEASVQPGKPASAIETEKDEFEDKAAETTKETEEPAAAGDREASETKDEASKVIAQPENTTDVDEMNAAADYSAPVEDESGTPETQPTFETIEGKLQQTDDAVSEQGPQDGCEANEKGEVITPGDQASSDTRSNELEGQKADDVNGLGQETEAGAEELSSDNSNTVGQESEANAKSTDEQVTLIDTIRTDQEEASVGAEKGSLPDSNACNDPVEPKKAEAVNDDNGPEPGERHDLPVEAVSDSLTDAEPVAINNDEAEEASGYLEVTDSHGVTDEQSEVSGVSEEKPKENIEVAEEAKETPDGETEANSGAASGEMIAATGAEFNQDPQSPSANEATVGAEDIVTPAVAETDSADNVDAAPENEIAIKPADHEELEETKVDNEPDADAERTVPTTDDVNAAITGSNLESDVVNVADADSTQKDPEEANTEQNIAHATEELNEPESSNADGLNHHEKGEETSPINLASEETDLTSTVSPNEAETNEMAKDERTEEEDRTKGETHCATEIDAECEESSNQKANDANAESKASEINEEQQPADKPDTIIDTESPSIQAGDVNESNENLEDAKQGEENMVNKDSPTADEGSVQEKVISVADGASEEAAENTTAEEAQDSEKEDSVNVVPVESNEQPATSEETQDVTSTYSEQQPVPTIENEQGESRIDDCGESQPAIDITPYVANQKDVELSGIELSATQVSEMAQLLTGKKDVTSIMLRNTSLNDNGLEQITNSLIGNDSLRYFNVNCNNITADGVHRVLTILENNPSIDSLAIHENPIGDEGVTILVQGLLKMYNALNPGQSSEDNDTRQSKNGLHATDSSATDSGRETGDATAVATAAGEDEEQRQDQSEVKASTDATAETTPNLASDSELDVAITGHSAASVDDSGHIEHEDGDAYGAVHENETREVTSPAVTDAVPGTAFTETKTRNLLNLRMLDIGACGMTSAGARCLAELIAANAGLTSLSLTGNKGVGIDGWESISQSLAVNVQLDTLELHHNGLGDAAVTSLVNGLSRNQSVITIDLEGNHIGSEGGRKIVELLQTAENLCNVHVRAGNNIPEDLVEEIEMLAESHG